MRECTSERRRRSRGVRHEFKTYFSSHLQHPAVCCLAAPAAKQIVRSAAIAEFKLRCAFIAQSQGKARGAGKDIHGGEALRRRHPGLRGTAEERTEKRRLPEHGWHRVSGLIEFRSGEEIFSAVGESRQEI